MSERLGREESYGWLFSRGRFGLGTWFVVGVWSRLRLAVEGRLLSPLMSSAAQQLYILVWILYCAPLLIDIYTGSREGEA